jgi:hypothetical protein
MRKPIGISFDTLNYWEDEVRFQWLGVEQKKVAPGRFFRQLQEIAKAWLTK